MNINQADKIAIYISGDFMKDIKVCYLFITWPSTHPILELYV